MFLYRRKPLPGGASFFTVTLRDRWATTLVDHVELLRGAFLAVRNQRPFRTEAMVVLPDRLHAIWTLPAGDGDFSGRWRAIKPAFVRALADSGVAMARIPGAVPSANAVGAGRPLASRRAASAMARYNPPRRLPEIDHAFQHRVRGRS